MIISEFSRKMDNWMNQHPIEEEENLEKIQHFIKNHILFISREDAEFYLPLITNRIKLIQKEHPLVKEIQKIRNNLLSKNALTIQDLPQETLAYILQQKYSLKNWKSLFITNLLFHNLTQDPTVIVQVRTSATKMPLEKKMALALKYSDSIFSLDLSNDGKVSDWHLEQLKQLSGLKHLNLAYCKNITDNGVNALIHLSGLKHLNLAYCKNITDNGVNALTHLKSLNIRSCHQLTGKALTSNNLYSLIARGCGHVIEQGIQYLGNIRSLDITGDLKLRDKHIKNLVNLQSLKAAACVCLTDDCLKDLVNLRSLNISLCRFTDRAFENLINLRSLIARHCHQLTVEAIRPLIHLQFIDVYGCKNLDGLVEFTKIGNSLSFYSERE